MSSDELGLEAQVASMAEQCRRVLVDREAAVGAKPGATRWEDLPEHMRQHYSGGHVGDESIEDDETYAADDLDPRFWGSPPTRWQRVKRWSWFRWQEFVDWLM